jgi:hypothetical protein
MDLAVKIIIQQGIHCDITAISCDFGYRFFQKWGIIYYCSNFFEGVI